MARVSNLSAALAIMTGAGLMLGAPQAQADAYQQDADFTVTSLNGNASTPVTFLGFDSALGTLNAVDLTLESPNVSGSATAYIGGEGGGYQFTQTVAIVQPNGQDLTSASGSASAGCGNGGFCSNSEPFKLDGSLSTSTEALTGGSELAYYENGPAVFQASLRDFTSSTCGDSQDSCTTTSSVTFDGSLNVRYEYTPAAMTSAAPEPVTWSLLSAGVGLAGFALRRARGSGTARA